MNGSKVRIESASDAKAVRSVIESAFGRQTEADLAEELRGSPGVFSLVATQAADVVGHVMFSPVVIHALKDRGTGLGLAPLSVRPDWQRRGVGTALVLAGLEEARRLGVAVVVVLGHPGYYPRFGFVPAASHGLTCKWSGDGSSFMVLEFKADALGGNGGTVEYAAAFDRF